MARNNYGFFGEMEEAWSKQGLGKIVEAPGEGLTLVFATQMGLQIKRMPPNLIGLQFK
jgi:hypothetical protein